jgi:hypothetical protein
MNFIMDFGVFWLVNVARSTPVLKYGPLEGADLQPNNHDPVPDNISAPPTLLPALYTLHYALCSACHYSMMSKKHPVYSCQYCRENPQGMR